jgi:hypothetical protein
MISEIDIQDMDPNHDLTSEEIINDDKAYWVNMELQLLYLEMGWGNLHINGNKKLYEE